MERVVNAMVFVSWKYNKSVMQDDVFLERVSFNKVYSSNGLFHLYSTITWRNVHLLSMYKYSTQLTYQYTSGVLMKIGLLNRSTKTWSIYGKLLEHLCNMQKYNAGKFFIPWLKCYLCFSD